MSTAATALGEIHEVPAEALRWKVDPATLRFETTQELEPLPGPLGQQRAFEALQFALSMNSHGFNVFVVGEPGTGRTTIAHNCVEDAARDRPAPQDWCYVHNFDDPYRPLAISFPSGRGRGFVRDLETLVQLVRERVRQAFESDEHRRHGDALRREHKRQHDAVMRQLEETARAMGFQVVISPTGIGTVPLVDGRPMTEQEFESLSEDQRTDLNQRSEQITEQVSETVAQIRALEQRLAQQLAEFDRSIARSTIDAVIDPIAERYRDVPRAADHLERIRQDMLEHFDDLRHRETTEREGTAALLERLEEVGREDFLTRYGANLVADSSEIGHAPIVYERNPTYFNLVGRIEYRARLGAMTTSFQLIKPGALHRANGGYLIVHALEILRNPLAWDVLKRSLITRQIVIENLAEQYSPIPTTPLRPDPIPLDVRVVLIGTPMLYYLLYFYDDDLRKLFKVKADLDVVTPRTPEQVHQYAALVSRIVRERDLLPFDRTGVARVVEESLRLSENQEKLSTRIMDVGDLVAEASSWAARSGKQVVSADHVGQAVDARTFRSNLVEQKLQELVDKDVIYIDTTGARLGQVNGLAVLTMGDYQFGRPVRVTARVAVGSGGPVNIEREAQLSGRIHNKGFMILTSFLLGRYGQDKPLALDARITFEQSYDEIEGDSASSTELYALLACLADLPLRQDVAVTGSIDQQGQIQAVGGVTHKIEGFFHVCQVKGLTGSQGVVVPKANLPNLMLRDEVVDAVRAGRFHVWAIETIDQGIELLTGVPAGRRRPDGSWEPDTVNDRIDRRLEDFSRRLRTYGRALERVEVVGLPTTPVGPRTPRVRLAGQPRRRRRRT